MRRGDYKLAIEEIKNGITMESLCVSDKIRLMNLIKIFK
jgi:hypothetical protein